MGELEREIKHFLEYEYAMKHGLAETQRKNVTCLSVDKSHVHTFEYAGTNPLSGQFIEECTYPGCRATRYTDPDDED